jgi:hypothetical protein
MTLSSIKQSPSLDPPKTSRKPYDVKGRGGRVEEAVLSLGNQKDFNGVAKQSGYLSIPTPKISTKGPRSLSV